LVHLSFTTKPFLSFKFSSLTIVIFQVCYHLLRLGKAHLFSFDRSMAYFWFLISHLCSSIWLLSTLFCFQLNLENRPCHSKRN
jgi:hypothetical protein